MAYLQAIRRRWPDALGRLVKDRAAAGAAFVIVVIYTLTAAAAFHGYYGKWEMMDGVAGQSVPDMLDGDANRPFVYRQLLPGAANIVQGAIPPDIAQNLEQRLVEAEGNLALEGGSDADKAGYVVRYRIIYYLAFGFLLSALFVLRQICIEVGSNPASATIAPIAFLLLFPVILTRGGYFYDLSELFFFSLATLWAIKGRFFLISLLSIPATLNKESFLFYLITLSPFAFYRRDRVRAFIFLFLSCLFSGFAYLVVRSIYSENPGVTANFQLLETSIFYFNPLNLLQLEQTYGVPLFKGYSAVTLGLIVVLAAGGWKTLPPVFQRYALFALAVNLPLFLLFCAEGEMRNLSMLYPPLVMLMSGAIDHWLATSAPKASQV